ncbi:MAG: lysylphosphatidylglycerol synthase transmembrane domain-containing protein [Anaerolineales bacterium]
MAPQQHTAGGTLSRTQAIWRWVRILMGAVGLILLIGLVDGEDVWQTLRTAQFIYFVPAWALLFLSTSTKTLRWWVVLRQTAVTIGFRRLLGTYLIGTFYSQFLPGSSAGGDAMRMAESSVDTGQGVSSVAAVIVERLVGLVTILCTASLILLVLRPPDVPFGVTALVYTLAVGGVLGLVVLRFGWFVGLGVHSLTRLGLHKIGEKVRALSLALRGGLGTGPTLTQLIVLSLIANFFSMSAFYLALLALAEPVPYFSFITFVALIVTLEVIPLTPGSLGIREGAYVFFLGYLGIAEADALGISLLIRVLTWSLGLVGGLVLMQRGMQSSGAVVSPPPLHNSPGD